MKTKKMILVAAMAIGAAALTAFTTMPKTDYPDEPEKTTRQDNVVPNGNEEDAGTLCPCSELRCGICGGKVEWTSQAYVKKREKCSYCNGTGKKYNDECPKCDGTGIFVEWGAGCRCYHCNQGFKQPNDC